MKLALPLLLLATCSLAISETEPTEEIDVIDIRYEDAGRERTKFTVVWPTHQQPESTYLRIYPTESRDSFDASEIEIPIRKKEVFAEIEEIEEFFEARKSLGHEWTSTFILNNSVIERVDIHFKISKHFGYTGDLKTYLEIHTDYYETNESENQSEQDNPITRP